jgi:hypothetical protein
MAAFVNMKDARASLKRTGATLTADGNIVKSTSVPTKSPPKVAPKPAKDTPSAVVKTALPVAPRTAKSKPPIMAPKPSKVADVVTPANLRSADFPTLAAAASLTFAEVAKSTTSDGFTPATKTKRTKLKFTAVNQGSAASAGAAAAAPAPATFGPVNRPAGYDKMVREENFFLAGEDLESIKPGMKPFDYNGIKLLLKPIYEGTAIHLPEDVAQALLKAGVYTIPMQRDQKTGQPILAVNEFMDFKLDANGHRIRDPKYPHRNMYVRQCHPNGTQCQRMHLNLYLGALILGYIDPNVDAKLKNLKRFLVSTAKRNIVKR